MRQIQGCPCPLPPQADPTGIWHFLFFLVKFPTMRAEGMRSQMPCPPPPTPPPGLKRQNPDWFQETWTKLPTLPFLLFFCILVQRLRSSFLFCVHSDHLGSRYELSAFGTLQSSVSGQEEVQEHESVHSKFCNSRVFFIRFVTIRLQLLAKKQILRKCT